MSSFTITVPDGYGYVILTTVVGQFVANQYMSIQVMKARKEYDVQYPNLYAVPGFHKQADAFNRVQRGHQNMFETSPTFTFLALIGGLKYPLSCSVCSILYNVGCVLYQAGYSDLTLDVNKARFQRGGGIKYLGLFGALFSTIAVVGDMNSWW